jgi:hypothetical protein
VGLSRHFANVTNDASLNGTLRECVDAYLALPPADRRDATIITDELCRSEPSRRSRC